jgi:hypothetical protein
MTVVLLVIPLQVFELLIPTAGSQSLEQGDHEEGHQCHTVRDHHDEGNRRHLYGLTSFTGS